MVFIFISRTINVGMRIELLWHILKRLNYSPPRPTQLLVKLALISDQGVKRALDGMLEVYLLFLYLPIAVPDFE